MEKWKRGGKVEIESKNIDDIIPYENNPRHNDEAAEYVAKSIKEFGFKNPIIIDKNNVIVAGHTRLKAAKILGLKNVPCIRADDLTDEQIKAFRLADNKLSEIATWDIEKLNIELQDINLDMSYFGFEDIDEPEIEIEDDNFNIDDIEEIKEPNAKPGDIYKLGNHRLMCGDSTKKEDVDKLMAGDIADLVVTDPPYNVAVSNSQGMTIQNDDMSNEKFKIFLESAFFNLSRNLKPGGAFYVWYGSREHINFETALIKNDLLVKQQLIWVKNIFNLGRQDYQWKHEPCLYGWKEGASHYFIDQYNHPTVLEDKVNFETLKKYEAIEMLKNIYNDGLSTTIIHEDKPTINDLHPTMKPLKLLARLVNNSSRKREIVLDLFGGSGSTLITCEQLNRKCYMIELDPKYVDVIIERWERLTGQKAVKVETQ